jgi:hypothetical protein
MTPLRTRNPFTVERLYRIIHDGELPDGNTVCWENDRTIKSVSDAFDHLDEDEKHKLSNRMGIDVNKSSALADELWVSINMKKLLNQEIASRVRPIGHVLESASQTRRCVDAEVVLFPSIANKPDGTIEGIQFHNGGSAYQSRRLFFRFVACAAAVVVFFGSVALSVTSHAPRNSDATRRLISAASANATGLAAEKVTYTADGELFFSATTLANNGRVARAFLPQGGTIMKNFRPPSIGFQRERADIDLANSELSVFAGRCGSKIDRLSDCDASFKRSRLSSR